MHNNSSHTAHKTTHSLCPWPTSLRLEQRRFPARHGDRPQIFPSSARSTMCAWHAHLAGLHRCAVFTRIISRLRARSARILEDFSLLLRYLPDSSHLPSLTHGHESILSDHLQPIMLFLPNSAFSVAIMLSFPTLQGAQDG